MNKKLLISLILNRIATLIPTNQNIKLDALRNDLICCSPKKHVGDMTQLYVW